MRVSPQLTLRKVEFTVPSLAKREREGVCRGERNRGQSMYFYILRYLPPLQTNDGEEAEAGEHATGGLYVQKWKIIRLAEPGPPGPLSAASLRKLGW